MKLAALAKDIPRLTAPEPLPDLAISGLTSDSREVKPGMLFAALPGTRADGMAYVPEALSRGAAAVLAAQGSDFKGQVPVLRAAEPRQALAIMAARFYALQPPTIAAVTGTNGKTSVAAFARQIWAASGLRSASLGTIGIVTGGETIPLAHTTPDPVILHSHLADLARSGVTHLALEASSHGLAQYRLDGVTLAAGAFTNITRDHLDYHGTFEAYLSAKMRLFAELLQPGKLAVIDADAEGGALIANAARSWDLNVLCIGKAADGIRLLHAERDGFRQWVTVEFEARRHTGRLPLTGEFQLSNALVAAGLAIGLGSEPEHVFAALEGLSGAKGRLEYVGETKAGAPVFIDYAHTPDALEKALLALRPYTSGRLHVVFGCGGDRDPGKRPIMGRTAAALADCVYVTDDNPRSEAPGAIRSAIMASAPGALEIDGRGAAINEAVSRMKAGDVLLIAGKGHETGQTIAGQTLPFSDHDAVQTALRTETRGRRRASGA